MVMRLNGLLPPAEAAAVDVTGLASDSDKSQGWRLGVAAALRAIETVQDAEECRRQVAALAEAGPPWQRVLGR